MAEHKFLVQLPDGTFIRKASSQLDDDDMLVFDGPDAFASTDKWAEAVRAEIDAAGGIDAWRALKLRDGLAEKPV